MNYIIMFIIGAFLGSFYNVIGSRIPKEESIIYPPSHCTHCNHRLKPYELIPIISYIIQKGKCRKCHKKIGIIYPMSEIITGIIFMISYKIYGPKPELIITLTFISMLIIITISDLNYMIIPDSILIFFTLALAIEIAIINGIDKLPIALINGTISFIMMYLLKKLGDFIFKKESMGGGDIKLMFLIGMTLSFNQSLLTLFLASLIGLPLSLLLMKNKESHIIPFGPLLAISACIIILTKINITNIINIYS